MDIRDKIKLVLKEKYGEFESDLEHKYEDKIIEILSNGDKDSKLVWMTYNQVILEFKNNLKDMLRVKELQYKLTDDCDPKIVCIEVIDKIKDRTIELDRLYNKIRNF